jgi:hypothetical protein
MKDLAIMGGIYTSSDRFLLGSPLSKNQRHRSSIEAPGYHWDRPKEDSDPFLGNGSPSNMTGIDPGLLQPFHMEISGEKW